MGDVFLLVGAVSLTGLLALTAIVGAGMALFFSAGRVAGWIADRLDRMPDPAEAEYQPLGGHLTLVPTTHEKGQS